MDILEVMKELEAKVKANEYLYENTRTHQCQCIYDILSASINMGFFVKLSVHTKHFFIA